jgi:DNA-binding transcriptional MerR regulator
MNTDATYDFNRLALLADVTPRAVRYYIRQGLFLAPGSEGPAFRYGRVHLDRLRLIRELQRDGEDLEDIRTYLEGLSAEEVRQLLETTPSMTAASITMDHVRSLMRAGPIEPFP